MIVSTVTGRLGMDAELRHTATGESILEFNVASSRKAKGEETTTWIRGKIWGKRGESLAQYLTKGTSVAIVGEQTVREYEKRDGTKGHSIELRVDQLDFIGGSKREHEAPVARPAATQGDAFEDDLFT